MSSLIVFMSLWALALSAGVTHYNTGVVAPAATTQVVTATHRQPHYTHGYRHPYYNYASNYYYNRPGTSRHYYPTNYFVQPHQTTHTRTYTYPTSTYQVQHYKKPATTQYYTGGTYQRPAVSNTYYRPRPAYTPYHTYNYQYTIGTAPSYYPSYHPTTYVNRPAYYQPTTYGRKSGYQY